MKTNRIFNKLKRPFSKYKETIPDGLEKYPEDDIDYGKYVGILKIIVDSEWSKHQLLLTSEYIHDLSQIDTEIKGVNTIAHLYLNPELIEVQDEHSKN